MKRKLLYILIAMLLVGVVLLIVAASMPKNQDSVSQRLFQVRTYNDLNLVAQNSKISVMQTASGVGVENVDTFGEQMTFSYVFDQNNNLRKLTVYCDFQANNAEAFKSKVTKMLNGFAELFNTTADQYYVFSDSDVYDCKDQQTIAKVFDGEATIEFRICDETSSYWITRIVKTGSDVYMCTIEHYIDDYQFNDMPVNIDLSQIK